MRTTVQCCLAGITFTAGVIGLAQGESTVDAGAVLRSRPFHVAPHIREAIRSRLAPYTPPVPADESVATVAAEPAEMKGEVLALPTMTVRRPMKESLSATDWMTPAGRLEYAMKRYPGARIGNFFGLNNGFALICLQEDLEVERMDALRHTGDVLLIEADEHDRETMKLLKNALIRRR